MKKDSLKNFLKENSYQVCMVLVVMLVSAVCLWNLGLHERVRRVADEIGYWGIAARMAGYDWEDVMATISYYSYGYSFLLVPLYWLYRLGVSISFCYKLAIIFNVILLDITVFLADYVARKWAPKVNAYYRLLCIAAITLYSSNIMQSNTAWTETCIYFLYWCILAAAIKFFESGKMQDMILLLALSVYLFAVHMRTIAVPIAVVLVLIGWFLGKNRASCQKMLKTALIFLGAILGLVLVVVVLKSYVERAIYGLDSVSEAAQNVNTFSGNLSKLAYFTSIDGWKDMILSFLGKVYYQGVATYLFSYLGFFLIIKQIFICIKTAGENEKKVVLEPWDYTGIIILLSTMGSLMVSTIFKVMPLYSGIVNKTRADDVVYGRYTEFLVNVLMLFAFLALGNLRKNAELILTSLVTMVICAAAVQHQWNIMSFYQEIGFANGVDSIARYFTSGFENTAYLAAMTAAGVFGVICFLCMRQSRQYKKYMRSFVVICLLVSFVRFGVADAKALATDKSNKAKSVSSITQLIEEIPDVPVYCVGNISTDIQILQWELADRSIQVIQLEDLERVREEEAIVISAQDHITVGQVADYMDLMYSSKTIAVYATRETYAGQTIMENIEAIRQQVNPQEETVDLVREVRTSTAGILNFEGEICFNQEEQEGPLTQEIDLTLEDGVYEFDVDIEISDITGGNIGYIVATDEASTYINTVPIDQEAFRFGKATVTISADVKNYAIPYIMVYSYGNCEMKITGIRYHQTQSITPRNAEEQDELKRILEVVDIENRKYNRIYYLDSDGSGITGDPNLMFDVYAERSEEDKKIVQLPYYAVKYLENKERCYFIVEKTGEYTQLLEFLTGYVNRYETQHFTLYMPENM